MAREKDQQIGIRLSKGELRQLDEEVDRLARETGLPVNRSSLIRRWLLRAIEERKGKKG